MTQTAPRADSPPTAGPDPRPAPSGRWAWVCGVVGRHRRDRGGRPGRLRDRPGRRSGAGRRLHDHQPAPGGTGQLGQGDARHGRQARAAGDHRARGAGAVRAGGSVGAASGVRRRAGVRGDRRDRSDRRADRRPVLDPGGRADGSRSVRRVSAAPAAGGPALSLVGGGNRSGSGDRGPGPPHLPDLDRRRRSRRDGRGRGWSLPGGHRGRGRGGPFAVPAADPDASRPGARRRRAR